MIYMNKQAGTTLIPSQKGYCDESQKKLINNSGLPQEMVEQVAMALLSAILTFYASEEG